MVVQEPFGLIEEPTEILSDVLLRFVPHREVVPIINVGKGDSKVPLPIHLSSCSLEVTCSEHGRVEIFIRPLEPNKMETHQTCNLDPLFHEKVEMDPELVTPPVTVLACPIMKGIIPIADPCSWPKLRWS